MYRFFPILFTLFLASCLTLLPMPEMANWLRPAWILMVLIFWTLYLPNVVNVGAAWLMGIWLDILTGTMIGEHALAMTVAIYLVYHSHLRIKMNPVIQQSISVCFFVLIYQAIIYGIQGFIGQAPESRLYWLSAVTSMVLWPWLTVTLRDYSRWMRLNFAK